MGTDYMSMPFMDLFHTVFTDDGQIKNCGRNACMAFIERLELAEGVSGKFGNIRTGCLFMPEAYLAACRLCK